MARALAALDPDSGAAEVAGELLTRPLRVCLVTEGSYPHYRGGVSTWCDMLVRGTPEVTYALISFVADPSAEAVYELPANVAGLQPVALWGTGEVLELERDLGLLDVLRRKRGTPRRVIERAFLPLFAEFLDLLWQAEAAPERFARLLRAMAGYFAVYDYDITVRSPAVWDAFLQHSVAAYERDAGEETVALADATDVMRLIYRWLTVLAVPIPDVDVVHAASAGLASIVGIVASGRPRTAFLLTEHGVYLRERLLALTRSEASPFEQAFQAAFAQRVTEASYWAARQIAPGSNYNHRWETTIGADPGIIQTIYNGPDPAEFTPTVLNRPKGEAPVVVWLGRIDPLKDLETLVRAAAIVNDQMPEVQFVLYGKAPRGNEWYYDRVLGLRDRLGLQDTVHFPGFAASAAAAYNEGDFVLLSSISEGFPYSVVEAMMCGRTVVGTDVGGVREALEGCGFVVEPRNPEQMAEACLTLLRDPDLARDLGQKARAKALERFSVQQCNAAYLAVYQRLTREAREGHPRATIAQVEGDSVALPAEVAQ